MRGPRREQAPVDLAYKDVTRSLLPAEPPAVVEVTVDPVGRDWEARVRFQRAGHAGIPLGRRFRAGTKGEALGQTRT